MHDCHSYNFCLTALQTLVCLCPIFWVQWDLDSPIALLSSCTSAGATHGWDKLCPAVATQTVPEDKLLQDPWQSHLLWGRKSGWCLLSWAKALKCMSSKPKIYVSSWAGSCGRTWQTQCTLPLLQAHCLSSLSVTRGPLFSGDTLNHLRIFA